MSASQQVRLILVVRKTRLQELVERFNTWPQAKFYLEHNQVDTNDYLEEHDLYQSRITEAEHILQRRGRLQKLERSFLPSFRFHPTDVVVVIGQDGLVANTLKYLDGQAVIAVNPDPGRWDGKILPFTIDDLREIVIAVEGKDMRCREITFAEAATNDGQRLLAVNDLFIGPKSHTSARYRLSWNGRSEVQSSSGIIVSTGFGSTGWFQSILAGALGIAGLHDHQLRQGFAWDEERLQFSVREPFPSRTTGTELVFGEVNPHTAIRLESFIPENGVIFSDGIESDYLSFNSGTLATIRVAPTRGKLVVGE